MSASSGFACDYVRWARPLHRSTCPGCDWWIPPSGSSLGPNGVVLLAGCLVLGWSANSAAVQHLKLPPLTAPLPRSKEACRTVAHGCNQAAAIDE